MTTEYELSKHRFYELKHFCLQFEEWFHIYYDSDGYSKESGKNEGDTTSKDGITRAEAHRRMMLVLDAAKDTGYEYWLELASYVTGSSKRVHSRLDKELFFYYYHKFFWILSKRRA